MIILHVCELATIRVLKECFALQQSGTPVVLWYKDCAHRGLLGWITHQSTWTDANQLKSKLKLATGFDAVHVHTTCTNAQLLTHVRQATDAKIIWDMHDWTPEVKPDEVLWACNKVIVPSKGYAKNLEKFGAEATVVYSMLPKDWFHDIGETRIDAGILESGIEGPKGKTWRDYTEAQKELCHQLYIYAGIDICVDGPHPLHAHYENLLLAAPYMGMMKQLSKYAFGYAGAANSRHDINICVTNKFWEYIAAGLPVVTYHATEMAEIVQESWTGVNLKLLDQPFTMPDRSTLAKDRFKFTMETQLETLKEVYQ